MDSHFLKFLKATLHFFGCWLFLKKWNNKIVLINITPSYNFNSLYRFIVRTKFWQIFKLNSPLKYGGIFFPKSFSLGDFWGKFLWRDCCTWWGLIIQSCQRRSFINTFSNNLNTVNLFPDHVRVFTWRLSPDQNYGRIYPWVNSQERVFKGCVMFNFPHVDPKLGHSYIIWKVNTTNRGLNLKNTLCTLCLVSLLKHPLHTMPCLSLVVTCILMPWLLDYRALSGLLNY